MMRLSTASPCLPRLRPRTAVCLVTALLVVVYLLRSAQHQRPRPHARLAVRYGTDQVVVAERKREGYADALRLTRFLAHEPGFSVVENLYFQNDMYHVLTDQPWSIPDQSYIAWNSIRDQEEKYMTVRIHAIRGERVSPLGDDSKTLGETVSASEAFQFSVAAQELAAPMLLCSDDNFTGHYYHWMGEMLLGGWRLWSNLKFRSGLALPDFKVVAFTQAWSEATRPADMDRPTWGWEDHAGANRFFDEAFFPGVVHEDKAIWDDRAANGTLYRLPLVLLMNREAAHKGHMSGHKPWGDVLRLPVHDDWLISLRDKLMAAHPPSVPAVRKSKTPMVRYLQRQDTTRKLQADLHLSLDAGLEALAAQGVIEYEMLHFSDGQSFADQIAYMMTTDILIGVHGNGLTHTLWQQPSSSVIELQPRECSLNDFAPLATVAGVQHYLIHGGEVCTPLECPPRSCELPGTAEWRKTHLGGVNTQEMIVDIDVVINHVRGLATGELGAVADE